MLPTKKHLSLCCAALAVGLEGCSLITDPSGLVGTGPTDAGLDGGGFDGGSLQDAQPPDGCVVADEVCNEIDDDCDGTVDESPTECSFPNGITGCVSGACELVGCVDDYGDCDDGVEGCEASLLQDRVHCGTCEEQCTWQQDCASGACAEPTITGELHVTGAGRQTITWLGSDADGNVYLGGTFESAIRIGTEARSATDLTTYVARWSTGAEADWIATIDAAAADFAVDDTGNVTVVGNYVGGIDTHDGRTLSFATSSEPYKWVVSTLGATSRLEQITLLSSVGGVAIEPVTGHSVASGATGSGPMLLIEPPRDLASLVSPELSGPVFVNDLVVNADGDILLVGRFADGASIGGTALEHEGIDDAFAAAYSPEGVFLWLITLHSNTYDEALGAAVAEDPDYWLVAVRTDGGPFTAGSQSEPGIGGSRLVVVALSGGGEVGWLYGTTVDPLITGPSSRIAAAGSSYSWTGLSRAGSLGPGLDGADVPDAATALGSGSTDGSASWGMAFGGGSAMVFPAAMGRVDGSTAALAMQFTTPVRFVDSIVSPDGEDAFVVRVDSP